MNLLPHKKIVIQKHPFPGILLFILLMVLSAYPAGAVTYYFSNTGNDSNSGLSPLSPFQTVTQLNSLNLNPGDSILLKSGDVFAGQIQLNFSGNPGQPVFIGKYGGSALPLITAARKIMNWINIGGNLYVANDTAIVKSFFMDGRRQQLSRYPNTGYLSVQAVSGNQYITDSALIQPADFWNGATVIIRTTDRLLEENTIDSFSNYRLKLHTPPVGAIDLHDEFFLENLSVIADTAGEWFYDPLNHQVYFFAPPGVDPNAHSMEAVETDEGITINNNMHDLVIADLAFEGQQSAGIDFLPQSNRCTIQRCVFSNQYRYGILLRDQNSAVRIDSSTFTGISGSAISCDHASGITIQHNSLLRTGLIAGNGLNDIHQGNAINLLSTNLCQVINTTIDSTGNAGLYTERTNGVIEKNITDHSMMLYNNGGAMNLTSGTGHLLLDGNFIYHTMGSLSGLYHGRNLSCGIYADSMTDHSIHIFQNTIAGASFAGIRLLNSNLDTIDRNVVYDARANGIRLEQDVPATTFQNNLSKNIFYSLHEDAFPAYFKSGDSLFNPVVADSDYYFNPYNNISVSIESPYNNFYVNNTYSLRRWKILQGQNLHSKESFVNWSRYIPVDTTGINLITNGSFDNTTDGWSNYPQTNNLILLDNATKLDEGCMKSVMMADTPRNRVSVYISGFGTDSSQFYLLSMSSFAKGKGDLFCSLRKNNDDFGYLSGLRFMGADTGRSENAFIIKPYITYATARLNIDNSIEDSVAWFDNIKLLPVTVSYKDPHLYNRLFTNASDTVRTFNLLDSVFLNTDSSVISGSLTLQPWHSDVLLWGSSSIPVSPSDVPAVSSVTGVSVFPNPSSGKVWVTCSSGIREITLLDAMGREIAVKRVLNGTAAEIDLQEYPAGMYLMRISGNSYSEIKKIVLIR